MDRLWNFQHRAEGLMIQGKPTAFVEEIIVAHCLTASPSELRKMAVQDREKGNLRFAYYLEVVADQREREEFT